MVTDIFERMERLGRWLDTVENPDLLSPSEKYIYEERLKIYRDFNNCMDFCEAKGRAEGRAKAEAKGRAEGEAIGKVNTINQLIDSGMSVETVANALHMTVNAIKDLISDKS